MSVSVCKRTGLGDLGVKDHKRYVWTGSLSHLSSENISVATWHVTSEYRGHRLQW